MPNKGYHHTEESNRKRSEALKGRTLSKETRRKVGLGQIGRVPSEEARRNISLALLGIHRGKETRRKMSIAKTKQWQDEEWSRKHVSTIMRTNRKRPNNTEIALDSMLQTYFPGLFRWVGNKPTVGRKCPDFIRVDGQKMLIEYNSYYWHQDLFKETNRIRYFKKHGYDCLVIWGDEWKDTVTIIAKIEGFIKKNNTKQEVM